MIMLTSFNFFIIKETIIKSVYQLFHGLCAFTQARNVTKSLDVLNVWIYRLVARRNDKKERESDIAIIDQWVKREYPITPIYK